MGYIYIISQARHLPGTAGGTQKVISPHISPAIPVGGGGGVGQGLQMTGALLNVAVLSMVQI